MYILTLREYTSLAEKRRKGSNKFLQMLKKKQADDAKRQADDAEKSDDKKDSKGDCKIDIDVNVK